MPVDFWQRAIWANWSPVARCPSGRACTVWQLNNSTCSACLSTTSRQHGLSSLMTSYNAAQALAALPYPGLATEAKLAHSSAPAPTAGGHPAQHQPRGAHTAEDQPGQVLWSLHMGPAGRGAGVQLHHHVPNAAVQVCRDCTLKALRRHMPPWPCLFL